MSMYDRDWYRENKKVVPFHQSKRKKAFVLLKNIIIILFIVAVIQYFPNIKRFLSERLQSSSTTNASLEEQIYNGISRYDTEIPLGIIIGKDADARVKTAYETVQGTHPEIFWLPNQYHLKMTSLSGAMSHDSGNDYTLSYKPWLQMESVPDMERSMREKVDQYIDSISENCHTDYQKAEMAHDLIVRDCEYDLETYLRSLLISGGSNNSLSYTAYGCLVDGTAVCNGYAKAYQLLMNNLGIECGIVSGTADNGEMNGPHAWNYIKIDGSYYFVDCTWDDPVGYSGDEVIHTYFCVDSETMGKNHFPDADQFVPVSTN